jgi:hypothetical protein
VVILARLWQNAFPGARPEPRETGGMIREKASRRVLHFTWPGAPEEAAIARQICTHKDKNRVLLR